MADIDSKLQIIIELLKKGQGATQATKDLEKLDKQQAKNKVSLQNLSSVYKAFASSVLGIFLVRHLKDSIKLFEAQEQAIAKLNGTLRASGQFSEEYSRELQRQASALQSVTRIGDETTLSVQQQLIAFGAQRDQIERLTEVTLDLAEGMGTDVKAAALLMGKAIAGEFSTLSRYGILVDEGADRSAKFAQAIEQIETRFGGLARAAAATRTGELQQMRNAFGDMKEEIGALTLALSSESGLTGALQDVAEYVTGVLQAFRTGPQGMFDAAVGARAQNLRDPAFDPPAVDAEAEAARRATEEKIRQLSLAIELRAIDSQRLSLMAAHAEELRQVNEELNEANVSREKQQRIMDNLRAAHQNEIHELEATMALERQRHFLLSQTGQLMTNTAQIFSATFSRGITEAFTSGGDAMKEFASTFLRATGEMIMQVVILNALMRAIGSFGGGSVPIGSVGGGFVSFNARGGMNPSKFAMGGVAAVDRATFFPQFNTVAGEAGKEFLTVLRNPQMMSLGGMPAAVGRIGNHQLAMVNFQQAKTRFMAEGGVAGEVPKQFAAITQGGGGGRGEIVVRLSPELRAEIVRDSVEGARLRVTEDMNQDSDLSRTTKRLIS